MNTRRRIAAAWLLTAGASLPAAARMRSVRAPSAGLIVATILPAGRQADRQGGGRPAGGAAAGAADGVGGGQIAKAMR